MSPLLPEPFLHKVFNTLTESIIDKTKFDLEV